MEPCVAIDYEAAGMSTIVKPRAGIALIFVVIFLLRGVWFMRANSPTYDEAMHLAAGYSHLATGDFRLDPQNPPLIKELLALPLFVTHRSPFTPEPEDWRNAAGYGIGQKFLYRSALSADRMLLWARSPNLILGALLVGLIGWWAHRLWGANAAIVAMALAAFEPNLIAHSALVTTDVGSTLFIVLTVYLLWEHRSIRAWPLLAGAGVSLGVALVCKFSSVLLIPLVAFLIALSTFLGSLQGRESPSVWVFRSAAAFFQVSFFAALIVPPVYFFRAFGFRPWLSGLRQFLTLARAGQPSFFLGEYRYEGWWNYHLVAFLLKTPLGSLALIALSLVFCRAGSSLRPRDASWLLLPVATILLVNAAAKVDIGLRHVLPVYPFLFVLASRLATVRLGRRWLAPGLIGAALGVTMISSLRVAPHELAYFNEIVGGPSEGYRYLADSNLDWGQDLKNLKAYTEEQNLPIIYLSYFGSAPPGYYGIRYQYVPGAWPLEWPPPGDTVPSAAPRKVLAISASNLLDVFDSHAPLFRWLRSRQPIAKIGYSIFVFDLTNDPAGVAMVERTYALAGLSPPPFTSLARPD
jgi:4-amino-4-deoxy-L-arabinose transferase-like glycosyltransferase